MSALNYSSVLQSLIGSLNAPSRATLSNPMAAQMGANKANAQRGQSILRLLDEGGQTAMADNQTALANQQGDIRQSMMDKGLANTTVGDNLNQGAQTQFDYANNRVRESTADSLARMAASFSQPGPDLRAMAPQMQGTEGRIIQGPDLGFAQNYRPFGG